MGGATLRFQEHEFKTRTVYGDIEGANLLDWPLSLRDLEPFYNEAEDKMGVTGTHGIPRLPGNNNYRVLEAGARRIGYQSVHTGNMAITPSRATTGQRADRSAFARAAVNRCEMVDALHGNPKG